MIEKELDLRGLVGLLSRQARLIAATVAIVLLATAIIVFSLTPTYEANTTIFVDTVRKDPLGRQVGGENSSADHARVESEVEIVLTDAVLMDVVNRTKLVQDPEFGVRLGIRDHVLAFLRVKDVELPSGPTALAGVIERLRKATTAERVGLTYLISVGVRSIDPEKAATLADAIARAYIDSQLNAKVQSTIDAHNVVTARLEAANNAAAESTRKFDDLIVQNAAEIAALSGVDDIAATGEKLREAVSRRSRNALLLDSVQRSISTDNWSRVAEDLQSQAIAELDRQRNVITASLEDATENPVNAVDLASELERVEARLAAEAKTSLSSLQTAIDDADEQAAQFRNQFRTDVITRRVPNLPPQLDSALAQVVKEGSIAQNQAELLLQRQKELEYEAGLQLADSRIVSPAMAPTTPASPNVKLIMTLAGIMSLGLGLGLGLIFENYVGGFTSIGQLASVLRTRPATSVPREKLDPAASSVADKVLNAPFSAYTESIRRLRGALDIATQNRAGADSLARQGRVIMVASAQPGEGKTTTSLALARIYALSGLKVLLIDCDTRKPSLHRQLNVEVQSGLADYLKEGSDGALPLSATAKDERSGAIAVLGKRPTDVPTDQLLGSQRFANFIQAAAAKFDVVILDTAPIGPVVDGLYVARHVDAVAFVVRWASTSQRAVVESLNQLRERTRRDVEILAVLCGESGRAPFYSNRYGEYYEG